MSVVAGGDHVKLFSVKECAANIDDDSGRGPWLNLHTMFEFDGETDNSVTFFVLAVSANEECFGVCQFAFKCSATRCIHSMPSCFMASRKWDARSYISLAFHNGNVLL